MLSISIRGHQVIETQPLIVWLRRFLRENMFPMAFPFYGGQLGPKMMKEYILKFTKFREKN